MKSLLSLIGLTLAGTFITFIILFTNSFLANAQSAASVWQPWVTAIGVISATYLAVWQQQKNSEREAEQRRRKNIAARSVMPAALSEICDYADVCVERLTKLYPRDEAIPILPEKFPVPDFPSDATDILKECIEHAEEEDGKKIAECIRKLQIQHSRVSSFFQSSTPRALPYSFDSMIIDTVSLHAYCSMLFPYARIEDAYQSSQTFELQTSISLHSLKIYEETFPSVYKLLRARGFNPI